MTAQLFKVSIVAFAHQEFLMHLLVGWLVNVLTCFPVSKTEFLSFFFFAFLGFLPQASKSKKDSKQTKGVINWILFQLAFLLNLSIYLPTTYLPTCVCLSARLYIYISLKKINKSESIFLKIQSVIV